MKQLFDKHFNMGVINVPYCLQPVASVNLAQVQSEVYALASVFIPLTLFSLRHSVNRLIFFSPVFCWFSRFGSLLNNFSNLPLLSFPAVSSPSFKKKSCLQAVFLYPSVLLAPVSLQVFFFTLLLEALVVSFSAYQ